MSATIDAINAMWNISNNFADRQRQQAQQTIDKFNQLAASGIPPSEKQVKQAQRAYGIFAQAVNMGDVWNAANKPANNAEEMVKKQEAQNSIRSVITAAENVHSPQVNIDPGMQMAMAYTGGGLQGNSRQLNAELMGTEEPDMVQLGQIMSAARELMEQPPAKLKAQQVAATGAAQQGMGVTNANASQGTVSNAGLNERAQSAPTAQLEQISAGNTPRPWGLSNSANAVAYLSQKAMEGEATAQELQMLQMLAGKQVMQSPEVQKYAGMHAAGVPAAHMENVANPEHAAKMRGLQVEGAEADIQYRQAATGAVEQQMKLATNEDIRQGIESNRGLLTTALTLGVIKPGDIQAVGNALKTGEFDKLPKSVVNKLADMSMVELAQAHMKLQNLQLEGMKIGSEIQLTGERAKLIKAQADNERAEMLKLGGVQDKDGSWSFPRGIKDTKTAQAVLNQLQSSVNSLYSNFKQPEGYDRKGNPRGTFDIKNEDVKTVIGNKEQLIQAIAENMTGVNLTPSKAETDAAEKAIYDATGGQTKGAPNVTAPKGSGGR